MNLARIPSKLFKPIDASLFFFVLGLASFRCWSKWKWKCLRRKSECSEMGFIDCAPWCLVPHFSLQYERNVNWWSSNFFSLPWRNTRLPHPFEIYLETSFSRQIDFYWIFDQVELTILFFNSRHGNVVSNSVFDWSYSRTSLNHYDILDFTNSFQWFQYSNFYANWLQASHRPQHLDDCCSIFRENNCPNTWSFDWTWLI